MAKMAAVTVDTVNLVTGCRGNNCLVEPRLLRPRKTNEISEFPTKFSVQINSRKPLFRSRGARRLSRAKGSVRCCANAEGDLKGNNCAFWLRIYSAAQEFSFQNPILALRAETFAPPLALSSNQRSINVCMMSVGYNSLSLHPSESNSRLSVPSFLLSFLRVLIHPQITTDTCTRARKLICTRVCIDICCKGTTTHYQPLTSHHYQSLHLSELQPDSSTSLCVPPVCFFLLPPRGDSVGLRRRQCAQRAKRRPLVGVHHKGCECTHAHVYIHKRT